MAVLRNINRFEDTVECEGEAFTVWERTESGERSRVGLYLGLALPTLPCSDVELQGV